MPIAPLHGITSRTSICQRFRQTHLKVISSLGIHLDVSRVKHPSWCLSPPLPHLMCQVWFQTLDLSLGTNGQTSDWQWQVGEESATYRWDPRRAQVKTFLALFGMQEKPVVFFRDGQLRGLCKFWACTRKGMRRAKGTCCDRTSWTRRIAIEDLFSEKARCGKCRLQHENNIKLQATSNYM